MLIKNKIVEIWDYEDINSFVERVTDEINNLKCTNIISTQFIENEGKLSAVIIYDEHSKIVEFDEREIRNIVKNYNKCGLMRLERTEE